jgi:hypothetical protein
MGVAQLTLSCDRSCDRIFITNLCFIRPFPISSILRADHGAGTPNAGFRFPMRRLAPNRMLEARAVVPAAEPRLALFPRKSAARAWSGKAGTGFPKRSCSNKKIERDDDSKKSHPALASTPSINIKAGCAPPGSVSNPDHGGGLHARPSEIGGPEPNVSASRDFVAWSPREPSKSQGIRPTGICRLRLAATSGISAVLELWPSG